MKRNLPKFDLSHRPQNLLAEAPKEAMARWKPEVHAAKDDDEGTTINVYDEIGETWYGEGMTVKKVAAILRQNKGKAITVNINSPGGDFFEGVAIYNALQSHDGEVTVRVIGLAASAASVIAMAGHKVEIAESAFLMIHNAWTIALGDRNEMQDVSDMLAKFDETMAALYSKRANGKTEKEIAKMMDATTWLNGADAIEMGLADSILDADELEVEEKSKSGKNAALKKADIALARAGVPRTERRQIFKEISSGAPEAAEDDHTTPGAGSENGVAALASLRDSLTAMNKETGHGY